MKRILILFTILFALSNVQGEPVQSKANMKRVELIGYLRTLEPMVKNYPNGKDGKDSKKYKEGKLYKQYEQIKRKVQEGILYFYEGGYANSYRRFVDAQTNTEKLLEELSQSYIERSENMLKSAVEVLDEKNKLDRDLMDISIEFSRTSKYRKSLIENRQPAVSNRHYDPKLYHYYVSKKTIEDSLAMGYKSLGQAKKARVKGLKVEQHLEKHQVLKPEMRKYRIERYLASITKCKDAKAAALNVFRLKYPYENAFIHANSPKEDEIAKGVTDLNDELQKKPRKYAYDNYPYLNKKKLPAPFDQRIPNKYRVDYADNQGQVYTDLVDEQLDLKYYPKQKENFKEIQEKYKSKAKDGGSSSQPSDTSATPDTPEPGTNP
ncbi:MAG: hypothetical protein AAF518_08585 [Spirochaetota bacterium]